MGAAPGPGWEEGEFEFKLVFEEDAPRPEEEGSGSVEPTDSSSSSVDGHRATANVELSPVSIPSPSPLANQRAGMHSPPPRRAPAREFSGTYESLPARSVQVSESRVVECPSIQITTISPEDEPTPALSWDAEGSGRWDRERLYLPLLDPFNYRDRCPGSLSPSPASSPSSRGWLSPASSCDSLLVEEEELSEATLHFGLSPSSRPTSPGGKKRRNSPLASPSSSRRGSFSDEQLGLDGRDPGLLSQASPESSELSVPQKTRKTSVEQLSPRDQEQTPGQQQPETLQNRRDPPSMSMNYLSVPPALAWGRTRASTHSPLFRTNALPPLDWPLPSQFDQYELRIEVQPRPHHRAHYETEGSRGAVKASPTGHPIIKLFGYNDRKPLSLQVFVGTADDRSIRPHPFYQIHRVTGKMVGTTSHESIQAGTKVLDIPLSPENHMTALIDCAGILKLRNSDIELRKGETDVGRKNTRVRLVFRTHLALAPSVAPPGRVLALQVASLPIECSQRSAQELPVIESVSLTSSSVEGGEELLLSGTNFMAISRVLFIERSTDGKLQWEEEAQVDRDNSNESLLCVRVPPYSDLSITHPMSVSLYVSNGKRKRSSTHCFKYVPIMFKEDDPLLSRSQGPPLDGGALCSSVGSQPSNNLRCDPMTDEQTGMGFHLPPYQSAYSPPCTTMAYPEEYGADNVVENPSGTGPTISEHHTSFENLELGFTELLPPLYLRGPQPPSPCPWLDSPYLSSSPSPSHSSSLSPFAAGSPISTSPLPPVPTSPYPQYCAYPQGISPSPPTQQSTYQDMCSAPYSKYESWDPPGGFLGVGHREERNAKIQDCPLEFTSSNTMHQITFEEVSEYIGQDMQSYQAAHMEKQPH
ncbi:nuclear factor of activated T-cells, cytoplasmic 4 isoform X1 [Corythoichthys intestinalis]|uniref:nuclear factor of activated T-cells, cytoplasmic 4 isoform X1 n=2 Tax=Corythoichthys intestinalis TaxID=161448 RepID=UPI0025A510CA|nr:nuclear factor of activated T-cells, cytoplasmic 4 isoform X1 [Corythoichthys intestinalis]